MHCFESLTVNVQKINTGGEERVYRHRLPPAAAFIILTMGVAEVGHFLNASHSCIVI